MRFFGPVKEVGWVVNRFIQVDYRERHGLVALHGSPERVVGHGFYAAITPGRAEVALEVADEFQGRGLGTTLVGYLAQAAVENGINVFEAEVLPENHRMIQVFRDTGYPVRTTALSGVLGIEFPTALTEAARERFAQRDHLAAVAAMRRFFEPRSIAVVGASRRRGTIGGELLRNLLDSEFPGPVYPVSPHEVVQSVPAYTSVTSIPGPVDLAVIAVPATAVVQVVDECASKGVGAIVVISAGFAETGEEGRSRQAELLDACRRSGIRLVGPNCMGLLNTDPAHRMNATFAPQFPPQGRVGFMSQSGALGLALIDRARGLGLGLSTFVSVGNKADISGNDLLEYWQEDESTKLVLLYLESFGNPRRFSRIARRLTRRKPILAVKSGRSRAGFRATSSHTGALLAASDATVAALFRQSGVIRCETLGEMLNVARFLALQEAPAGRRVAILTNAGGLAILCADACDGLGLEVPELAEDTRRALTAFLPAAASVANPVDMLASATGEDYERALAVLAEAQEVDAIIAIFVPPLVTPPADIEAAIRRATPALAGRKPLAIVFTSASAPSTLEGADVPVYSLPEEAAQALGRIREWTQARERDPEPAFGAEVRHDEAEAIVAEALGRNQPGGWLTLAQCTRLLNCYGIPLATWRSADDANAAGAAAKQLKGPLALKAVVPGLLHKSDAGAVAVGLAGADEVRKTARVMADRLAANDLQIESFIVQSMAPPGIEMLVGMVQDPTFGPVVACGAGGVAVELTGDVGFRLAPLTERDATELIDGLKVRPLLRGYRGSPPSDVAALRDVVLRVGLLADGVSAIAELDLNPVVAGAGGSIVVDVRIRVQPAGFRPPEGARPRPAAS